MRQFIVYDQCSKGCPDSKQIKKIRSHSATQAHYQRKAASSGIRFSTREGTCDSVVRKGVAVKSNHASQPDDWGTSAVLSPYPQSPIASLEENWHGAESISNNPGSTYTSLPLRLQPFEHKLVEYYVNVLAREHYGLPGGHDRPTRFNPWRDTNFQIALQHPMLFRLVVLGIAAGHAKATRGVQFTKDLEYQQYKSLREMQLYFTEEGDDCSDTRIAACLFRAMLETCLGTAGHPLIHMRAASLMVQKRGGAKALQHNHHLMVLLYSFSWRFARDGFDGPEWRTSHPESVSSISATSINHFETTNSYIDFLVDAEILSRRQKTAEYRQRLPLRHAVFTESAYIAKMIYSGTTTAHPFQWADGDWLNVLALVVYLNRALLDYEHDAATTELFLSDFRTRMKMMEYDGHKSIRAVIKMLLYPSQHKPLNERHWKRWHFAGRMLQWAVQLNREYEEKVMLHLHGNLTFRHERTRGSSFAFEAEVVKLVERSV